MVAVDLCPLVVPLGSALFWLISMRTIDRHSADASTPADTFFSLRQPAIWLFAAFLLAGSVVRGIADSAVIHPDPRRALSLPITGLLVVACVFYALAARRKRRSADSLPFILGCWIGFAALFFGGIFVFLASDDLALGGSLVVIARSMLEIVLWMLLCDYASHRSDLAVPLFIVGGVFVETLSWAVSYVAVPALVPQTGGTVEPQMLALISIFGLAAVITTVCGVLLVLQSTRRSIAVQESVASRTAEQPEVSDERVAQRLEISRGLTAREAQVALLYARGYSLSKVAEELGVTTSSAQTSIKNVYRKLDVHSKNELIATVAALRAR